jgi:hypothetical protein
LELLHYITSAKGEKMPLVGASHLRGRPTAASPLRATCALSQVMELSDKHRASAERQRHLEDRRACRDRGLTETGAPRDGDAPTGSIA